MSKYLLLIALAVLLFAMAILNLVRQNKLTMKYALLWLGLSLLTIIALIWPGLLNALSSLLGFVSMSNMLFLIAIFVLILICVSLSVIVSNQTKKIILLIQEVSLLKSKYEQKGIKNEE